jgi:N-methylhydantoinase B
MVTATGGGWGEPGERDPAAVRADVLDGYVTADVARSIYGVDVDGD